MTGSGKYWKNPLSFHPRSHSTQTKEDTSNASNPPQVDFFVGGSEELNRDYFAGLPPDTRSTAVRTAGTFVPPVASTQFGPNGVENPVNVPDHVVAGSESRIMGKGQKDSRNRAAAGLVSSSPPHRAVLPMNGVVPPPSPPTSSSSCNEVETGSPHNSQNRLSGHHSPSSSVLNANIVPERSCVLQRPDTPSDVSKSAVFKPRTPPFQEVSSSVLNANLVVPERSCQLHRIDSPSYVPKDTMTSPSDQSGSAVFKPQTPPFQEVSSSVLNANVVPERSCQLHRIDSPSYVPKEKRAKSSSRFPTLPESQQPSLIHSSMVSSPVIQLEHSRRSRSDEEELNLGSLEVERWGFIFSVVYMGLFHTTNIWRIFKICTVFAVGHRRKLPNMHFVFPTLPR